MALMFYNTLTRKKEKFVPLSKDSIRMYTCGPTVYNYAHIGNFRAYIFEDLLRRYLKYKGFKVKQVMNITDVDDKTIRDSKKEKISLKEFTAKYEKAFFEDLKTLNIEKAELYPKATEHIKEMIELIKAILDNEIAYVGEDKSVYYNVGKFKGYGKLAHIKVDELKTGARISHDEYEKEHAADFALWKAWDKEDGDVFWESPFGNGRPGWHIECSAMSMKHLSKAFENKKFNPKGFETIDIHTGGVDNIFPHHENEIAQSEAAAGKKFVNYWMHCEHLLVDGKKMSKSLGNFYTLRDLLDKGLKPKSIRWVLLTTHYRQQLNFTLDSVKAADNSIDRLMEFIGKLEMYKSDAEDNKDVRADIDIAKNDFEEKLDDELNISGAAAAIFDFVRHINRLIDQKKISNKDRNLILKQMKDFDKVLGVLHKDDEKIPKEIADLAEKRKHARKNKDFKAADKLREELNKKGYVIEDLKDGKGGYLIRKK